MHPVEIALARFGEDTDQIDDDLRALDGARNRGLVGQRHGERHDLPDPAHRPEIVGHRRVAHRDPDHVAVRRQATDDIAAEEA